MKVYPSDLSDLEWEKIEPLFKVDYSRGGRPPKQSRREVLNAIFMWQKQDASGDFFQQPTLHGKRFIPILENNVHLSASKRPIFAIVSSIVLH